MQNLSPLQTAIVEAIYNKKGKKVSIIDLEKIESSPAPAMIVCQARSSAQVGAIADTIIDEVQKNLHIKPYASDGFRNAQWIIVDYGSVMVHVFQPEVREFYRLEDLWSDGVITELPDED